MGGFELSLLVIFVTLWGLSLFGLGYWLGHTVATFNRGMEDLKEGVAKTRDNLLKCCQTED